MGYESERLARLTGEGSYRYSFPDGRILSANRELTRILDLDCPPEALIGKPVGDLVIFGEQEPRVKRALEDDGEVRGLECRIPTRGGGHKWVLLYAAVTEDPMRGKKIVEAILRDITPHKEADLEFASLRKQIEFILGVTKTGLDIIDSEFNIRYIDPEWRKAYGDPTGKKCYEYFMGRKRMCPGCGIPKALRTGAPVVREQILVKEGNRPIQVTTIPFRNEKGELLVAEVNADIAERKKIEEELRKYRERLEEMVLERTISLREANKQLLQEIADRRRAEREIAEAEHFLSNIFTSIQDGISILDKNMRIIRVNPTMERWYEHAMPLIGKKCYEAYHWRTRPCAVCPTRRALRTRKPAYEVVPKTGAGKVVTGWLGLYSFPLIDEKTGKMKGVIEYVRDITEAWEAENELKKSENRFKQVAEAAGEWIWEVDAKGLYTYASPAVKKILGYAPEEVVGKKRFYDLFLPEMRDRLKRKAFGVFSRKREFRKLLNPNVRKDGRVVILETSGSPILDEKGRLLGYLGADNDITERMRAEVELRESEGKYRAMMDDAGDAIILADMNGKLLEANKKAEELFGYRKDALGRMRLLDLHPPSEHARITSTFKRVARSGRAILLDSLVLRKDGSTVPVDISGSLIRYAGKKVAQGIFRDVSERKKLDMMKENLIRDVSHELKAPIATMEMAHAMARPAFEAGDADALKRACEIIFRNLRVLRRDVDNILESFALGSGLVIVRKQRFSLRGLVEEIAGDFKFLLEERQIALKISLPSSVRTIRADRRAIRTLLYNILDNAVKFTKKGSISLSAGLRGDWFIIKVCDTGVGLARGEKGLLFTKFYKGHPSLHGTGLGLSICRDIVRACGGSITLSSKGLRKGTMVTVKLPRGAVGK